MPENSKQLPAPGHAPPGKNAAKNLEGGIITYPDDPGFVEFCALYKRVFTLPEESESEEGLKDILAHNPDPELQRRFGPHEFFLPCVRDRNTGKIVGGAVILSTTLPEGKTIDGVQGTAHVYYIFVDEDYRSAGIGSLLLKMSEKHCRDLARNARRDVAEPAIAVFCEQNAPLKMTPAQYRQDNDNAKLDQCDRLSWWQHQGFRRIDLPYSVPASSDANQPCDYLTLNVKLPAGNRVSSRLVEHHLNRFFSICLFHGGDAAGNRFCLRTLFEAHRRNALPLIDDQAGLPELKRRIYAVLPGAGGGEGSRGVTLEKLVGEQDNRPMPPRHQPLKPSGPRR